MEPTVPELPRGPRRSRARRPRVLIATAGTALLALSCVAAVAATQASSARAATASALTDNWYESAPYYSVLDSAAPDLGTVMSATGQKAFDMAFILADNGSSCSPAWN